MTAHRERQALISALCAVLLWSTVATGFKLGLTHMAPVQLLLAGSTVSLIVFAGVAARLGWPRQHLKVGEGLRLGLLNPVIYYLVLLEAYDRLPAQIAQPLNYTWAIVLALLAVPLLGQRLSARTGAGIALGYVGVVVLLTGGRLGTLPELDWLGVALALGSTFIWASYWLLNARSTTEPAALMATSFLFAVPVLGVICALGPGLPPMDANTLLYGAWVGLLEMGVTFLLWQRALRLTHHAARIGQLIFLAPFLSLILIDGILDEDVRLASWIGLSIIVLGLIVAGRPVATPR